MRPRGIKKYHLYFICCRVEIIPYKHTLAKSYILQQHEKIVNSCVSDRQLLIVCHIKIVVKSYEIFYDLKPLGELWHFKYRYIY